MSYRLLLFIIPFVSLLGLSACSPLEMLNATVSDEGYTSVLNKPYGNKPRQSLNIHIPRQVKKNADVVVFFYGGRWQYGSKDEYAFVADALTSQGFITVIADYRLYPRVDWREFVQDGASAYQWVAQNIQKYGGNPKRIFVMGHSAGAHIAAMAAVDESLLAKGTKRPCGLIGLAGPYDFLPIRDEDVKRIYSTAADLKNTQPITFVSKGDPAMLLLHGEDDEAVKPKNSINMAARAKLLGVPAEVKLYKDTDHIDILISLSSTFRSYTPALKETADFIARTVCK